MNTNKDYVPVESELLTNNYTHIQYQVVTPKTDAPSDYYILACNNNVVINNIHFQSGTVIDVGVNGIFIEDLLSICINRLEHFQNSKLNCRENAMAITRLQEATMWLNKRTLDRKKRGVEGTYNI